MTMYKNLTTVCAAAVLAFGLAACGGGDDDTAMMDPPPPPPPMPMPVAVDLMGSTDLMAGMTTIPAGGSVMVGYTTVSCAAGGADCMLTVSRDPVTGAMSASTLGGMATVAVMIPEPPPPPPEPPMQTACEMGAGMACIDQRSMELTGARAALAAAQADGSSTQDQLSDAAMAVTDAESAVMAAQAAYDLIRVRMVALPEGHGLSEGTTIIPMGDTTVGDTTLSCDGPSGCTMTVTQDTVTGQHSATVTGGMVTVMVAEAPMPPTPEPDPMPTAIELPAGNTVHQQLVAGGPSRLTIAAGNSADYGGVRFSCPDGGPACIVDFTDDINMAGAEAPVGSGVADTGTIPNPTFGGGGEVGYLSNENLVAAVDWDGSDVGASGRGLDASGDGYNDFTAADATEVGSVTMIDGITLTGNGPRMPQMLRLHSTVMADTMDEFGEVYGANVTPASYDGFWSKIRDSGTTLTGLTRSYVAGNDAPNTIEFAGAMGTLTCVSGVCSLSNIGGRFSGEGAWRFSPAANAMVDVPDDDYIVFGWWQNAPTGLPRETRALWAGNDPFESANVAGLTGSATYNGGAVGHYEKRDAAMNGIDRGTFTADAELTANFSENRIHGTIDMFDAAAATALGAGVSVTLGNTSLSGSTFSGSVGMASTADSRTGVTGSWNGQFFGNGPLDSTQPGAVAGEFLAATGSMTQQAGESGAEPAYINVNGAFGATR